MTLSSTDPATDEVVGTVDETSAEQLERVLVDAVAASTILRRSRASTRGAWIRAVADALDAHADDLIGLAGQETGLPQGRLVGELARATAQLRFLAAEAETGLPIEATIDTADPQWSPAPRPDLRSVKVALGPVLVFAASNFPFAFSVAGGDTASAWAAGCPVVVKAHPGHPLLSASVADLACEALRATGAPDGMLAVVLGVDVGVAALSDLRIAAGAFTGSTAGGRALFDVVNRRLVPVPFFAEMGSVNPVVITEQASAERATAIASGLLESYLLSGGQFCTKPGLVFVPEQSAILDMLADAVRDRPASLMLSHTIRDRHRDSVTALNLDDAVQVLAVGQIPASSTGAFEAASVSVTSAAQLSERLDLFVEEHFGPSTLLVTYRTSAELAEILVRLPGSLTGTVQRAPGEEVSDLVEVLTDRVGRVVVDEWPTGVAVTYAQVHGGPYPATTDPRFTSVGTSSIGRFLRTVAFQNVPDDTLPEALQNANPTGIVRRVNGTRTSAAVGEAT